MRERMIHRTLLAVMAASMLLLGPAPLAHAVLVGEVRFDVFIPADPGPPEIPGTTAFPVDNDTGPFALPPDFPVVDSLVFENASLTLALSGGGTEVIDLGDIPPGSITSPLTFHVDTASFTSAIFAATLSTTTFLLSDGSTFHAASGALTGTILPTGGRTTLLAGTDSTLLDVAGVADAPVPAPATAAMLAVALGVLITTRTARWRRVPTCSRTSM